MTESKIDATDRLRREGRWAAASKFRDEKRREYKSGGMKRAEAAEAAWAATLAEFPPQPDAEGDKGPGATPDAEVIAAIMSRTAGRQPDVVADLAWVYDRVGDDAVAPAEFPSLGAWSLWRWARANRARFFERLAPHVAVDTKAHSHNDSFDAQQADDFAEHRAHWKEHMAEDPVDGMIDFASSTLTWRIENRFNVDPLPGSCTAHLARMMHAAALRRITSGKPEFAPRV